MQLQAVSIGSAVPQNNFNATIQSLFVSSLNLRLDNYDKLITILVSDHYDLPQGIRVNQTLPIQPLNIGGAAVSRGGIIRFESSPLAIDLRGAKIWGGKLPHLNEPTEQAWSIIWQTLNAGQIQSKSDLIAEELFQPDHAPHLTRNLSMPVRGLIAAAERFDPHACTDAAKKMIGLGPGVTPTGDDILIGFMAGLYCMLGCKTDRLNFIEEFGKGLFFLSKKTNEISRTYIQHAIKGEFSSSMVGLIEAIRAGDEGRLICATKSTMQIGHSSGMDSITGFLVALAAWNSTSFYTKYKD